MKRLIANGFAAGALAMALSAGDVAAAQIPVPNAAIVQPQRGSPGVTAHGNGLRGLRGGTTALIQATATTTGLTTAQVVTELRGRSLAQIAQARGKTANDIIQTARIAYGNTLNQAVANGRIPRAQADAALARFDQNATQIVNATTLGQRARRGTSVRSGRHTRTRS